MVRVGTLLTLQALTKGRLIDQLVVFGMLVNHRSGITLPMKYHVNFKDDSCKFLIGDEMNLANAFIAIVQMMHSY